MRIVGRLQHPQCRCSRCTWNLFGGDRKTPTTRAAVWLPNWSRDKKLSAHSAWVRARLGMENDRLRVATQAVAALDSDYVKTVNTIYSNAGQVSERQSHRAASTDARICIARTDPAGLYTDPESVQLLKIDKLRWKAQLNQEERSWVWGVIGKRLAAQRLSDEAPAYLCQRPIQRKCTKTIWSGPHACCAPWPVAGAKWRMRLPPCRTPCATTRPGSIGAPARWLNATTSKPPRWRARRLLESIAGTKGFYEMLALEELGQKIVVPA